MLRADDPELRADQPDATRLVFGVTDKFGAPRLHAGGEVAFEATGPGVIVGDNPFLLTDSGGVGAVWVRTLPGNAGVIVVKARHSTLGAKSVTIRVPAGARAKDITRGVGAPGWRAAATRA